MEIKYLGDKTIFLKGKKEAILVDPDGNLIDGDKFGCRIILYTNEEGRQPDLFGDKVLINGPGEYEIGGVEINGINGEDGNTVYKVIIDGLKVVVIGELKQELNEKRVERIEEADILLTSPKLNGVVSYKILKELAKKWGVNYLIPITLEKESLEAFLDEADVEGLEPSESLKLEKVDDLPDGLEVKLLKPLK